MDVIRYVNNVPISGQLPVKKTSSQATIQIIKQINSRTRAEENTGEEFISNAHTLASFSPTS